MESSNVIPTYLNEEDILASLLDTPSNCFDLCLSDLTPSPGACLPEVKLDRESGELEDEGFEGKKIIIVMTCGINVSFH